MTLLNRDQVLARFRQLPSLPVAVSDLLASFGNEDVDVEQIARQIARDQALTARVLRVANSSFYGLQSRVGTINEAVVVLGFRAVRSMVMAVAMNGIFRVDQCRNFDAQAYLRHGVGAALAARALAPLAGHNPELAFTGGLLHDIGQLVLAANFSAQYSAVLDYRSKHDCQLVIAERDILGIDHAEVGGMLATSWRFPESLRQAVAEHHAPASSLANSLANVVHIADAFAHALGLSGTPSELAVPVDKTAWERLGLDGDKCGKTLGEIERAFDDTYLVLKP
ncbi:MAG: HDOD domain-containing protein [Rhodocyclaceae bacterium]|nr:HDOD domain-containing protein [Rhodocyclaceae bacterium]